MGDDQIVRSGHPRTRGARSAFRDEPVHGGEFPIRFGTVDSFDGTPIFYCEEGEGPPLVFCYGIACSTLHWTYQIDYFRKNYRCIWFDYRGHRNTPLPAKSETLTIEATVKDIRLILDTLGVGPAAFLGHSMGVSVVLEFARQYPESVSKMVLACGTAKKPLETLLGGGYLAPAFDFLSQTERQKPSLIQSLWKLQGKAPPVEWMLGSLGFNRSLSHPEDIKTYARQIVELPPTVLTNMMNDYQKFDATPWLHELKQPTLVISGEKDLITPPHTQDLIAQLMPNAELAKIYQGSHCATLDLPEYINLLIEKFLTSK